nr:cadherin EGF LAG seven-pass G-type receptor 3-like [Pocillopora verrucosa]
MVLLFKDGTAIASVTITVNDVNEAPSFTLSLYSSEISENSAHGVDIITITAVDPDGGDTLTYNLSGSGSSLFNALSNGIIEVAGSLDFETTPSYSLTLTATDSGSLTDTTAVVITVGDVNVSPSSVGAPYSSIVPENDAAASVVTVAATDPDLGDSITFSLSGAKSSDFTIHPTSGVVTLNNALNYESLNLYSLTVTASDDNSYGNGSVTSTFLTVTVTNRNDVPVSLSNSYSATIAEDEPGGTNVLKTGASDEDGHGILFSLSGSSDFDILNTGMIRIKTGVTLDYETQDIYNLTVEFSDGTASISKFVSITVLDRNDAPTLPSSPYSTNVSEEVPIGTSVFVASASDQDEDSLVYSLSGAGVTHFTIDSNMGIVTTFQALNF